MQICRSPTVTPGSTNATLGPDARALYRAIEVFTAKNGMEPPHILSTCRSWAHQMELQQRWDAGDRVGIAARPADPEDSSHVPDEFGICHAFDLANNPDWLKTVGRHVLNSFPSAHWGGTFLPQDLPHFHVVPDRRWINAATFRI